MKNTTLCYIENNGQYLMLHRTKKQHDPNEGKWIGIGGKLEENESPDEGMCREVCEETGLVLKSFKPRGIVTFISDKWQGEYMHLYTSSDFYGDIHECDEGDLKWVDIDRIFDLNLWQGDNIFLKLLTENVPFFLLKLVYSGDTLVSAVLDGKEIKLK